MKFSDKQWYTTLLSFSSYRYPTCLVVKDEDFIVASLDMYPNPMQQGAPMPRPHIMMNAAPMPQQNSAVGMSSMRPMVASSPMQASMLQQSGQSPMMVRPGGGSPYGVVNRAPLYDKNKRSVYSNDLRQSPMVQPGPPPQQMVYVNAPGPHPSMMPNAVPQMGGGAVRQ